MSLLQLIKVSKSFGQTAAVRSLSLEMEQGEILCLLGPSGCGKTTVLRTVAGFEIPDEGSIHFNGEEITHQSPQRRRFGMVFQSYALFPHMNVFENVAFGLKVRRVRGNDMAGRVNRALELVQLADKLERKVQQLSGGEQQRVAVARAIVIEPRLLLLDEPLSNLDASLREVTRTQLRQLIKKLGMSAIFVTHDQLEAFALADRVAVLKAGVLQQTGSPSEIYRRPANLFVAHFVGKSNTLRVQTTQGSKEFHVGGRLWEAREPPQFSGTMAAVFRPEQVRLGDAPLNSAVLEVVDVQQTVQGFRISGHIEGNTVEMLLPPTESGGGNEGTTGSRIPIHVPPDAVFLFADE
jgi:iron(III) transport system ATP-binding protein